MKNNVSGFIRETESKNSGFSIIYTQTTTGYHNHGNHYFLTITYIQSPKLPRRLNV